MTVAILNGFSAIKRAIGTTVVVSGLVAHCEDYSPFGPEFRQFCGIDFSIVLTPEPNATVVTDKGSNGADAILGLVQNRTVTAGYNVTGVIMTQGDYSQVRCLESYVAYSH